MFKSLLRYFGITKESEEQDKFDPIYGLPKRALQDWLSRNPTLSIEYNAKLRDRSSATGPSLYPWLVPE